MTPKIRLHIALIIGLLAFSTAVHAADKPLPLQQWELRLEDVRLDKALARWAKEAGYSFRWDADRYLLIGAASTFEGTLPEAVQQVLETPGIAYSEYPLEACIYSNSPPLLRITRLGDQVRECH
ncbi:MAG TPA: TcpQ domain-containing protein [Limnobacter sp.]|nr:TcpQ domain-containing protein [Limnobacter sp.]